MYAGRPPQQVAASVQTRQDLASLCILGLLQLLLTRSAVSANFGLLFHFWAEMAHQSPYRTGVLCLPILAN